MVNVSTSESRLPSSMLSCFGLWLIVIPLMSKPSRVVKFSPPVRLRATDGSIRRRYQDSTSTRPPLALQRFSINSIAPSVVSNSTCSSTHLSRSELQAKVSHNTLKYTLLRKFSVLQHSILITRTADSGRFHVLFLRKRKGTPSQMFAK